jgi:hypothetical protein
VVSAACRKHLRRSLTVSVLLEGPRERNNVASITVSVYFPVMKIVFEAIETTGLTNFGARR